MKSQPQSQRSIRLAQPCGDLHCERVLQFDQFTDAFRITHASYSERGFILPNATGLWMNRHHLLSSTRVFAVSSATQGKGTLTLAEDGPLGLPMETQFRREVVQRRRQFGSIAEATCLALDKRGSTAGPEIVNRLMGAVVKPCAVGSKPNCHYRPSATCALLYPDGRISSDWPAATLSGRTRPSGRSLSATLADAQHGLPRRIR